MSEQHTAIRPLAGKRILVTRTREQASVLSERLSTLGAIPIEFPTIRIVPPSDWSALDNALKRLFPTEDTPKAGLQGAASPLPGTGVSPENPFSLFAPPQAAQEAEGAFSAFPKNVGQSDNNGRPYYSWLVFTSANGVNICCERLLTLGYDITTLRNIRVATIGPATAAALTHYGLHADLIPDEYRAEGVSAALIKDFQRRGVPIEGQHILLPRAAEARQVLVTDLQQAGAVVDEVTAYHTHSVASDDEQGQDILHLLQTGKLDIITFASSSTVRNFMQWLLSCEEKGVVNATHLVTQNPQLHIACIGPITSQTARELGLTVTIEATEFTIAGLVEAIIHAIKE